MGLLDSGPRADSDEGLYSLTSLSVDNPTGIYRWPRLRWRFKVHEDYLLIKKKSCNDAYEISADNERCLLRVKEIADR
jgi:hypothetical protein